MQENARPTFVVLTPVRNEAWILRAFLEATSLWADFIIIADQMSEDGSREIVKSFPKAILVDNDRKEMHQAATRRLLFEESRKIPGDKILFAMDADEFLSGDFIHTEDWKRIVNSGPNDMFWWRWMNLKRDDPTQYSTFKHYYWAVHESDSVWEGDFPDNFIHEWRLPWLADAGSFELNDFCSIHFARVNSLRQRNKERFYQVSTLSRNPSANPIKLYRQYHAEEKLTYVPLPDDAYCFYHAHGIDIWKLVDLKDEGDYYSKEILRLFTEKGTGKFALLDIWDQDWMNKFGIKDPRTRFQKIIHKYLSVTTQYSRSLFVRVLDKIVELLVK